MGDSFVSLYFVVHFTYNYAKCRMSFYLKMVAIDSSVSVAIEPPDMLLHIYRAVHSQSEVKNVPASSTFGTLKLVPISEGPLSELPLYYMITAKFMQGREFWPPCMIQRSLRFRTIPFSLTIVESLGYFPESPCSYTYVSIDLPSGILAALHDKSAPADFNWKSPTCRATLTINPCAPSQPTFFHLHDLLEKIPCIVYS